MNSEMMEALENIEREKGISIEIMLEALANALLTAYKRMPDAAEEALVEIDMETGAIKVIAQELDEEGNVTREWDDTPTDFGRIAAQTAKQVIFQRIREAEREMKYEEYAGREGDIVTGIIQQTDARYTLLDLGKVEALLPQAEQVQNEHYDHGSRLKAYIVEVRKTAKGPQIVVSRTHPGLVKRLFELEVPEIVDGVVELKAIAREPGHRTKLAVVVQRQQRRPRRRLRRCAWFARPHGRQRVARREGRHRPLQRRPVGVRDEGARAGSVREVRIHPDTGTAEVIVPDFQLSLAIGKEGQNARLAARLTGWRVDIKSEAQLAEEEAGGGVEYAEGEWVTNDIGELVWQPAEGGDAISAAEAGYAAPAPETAAAAPGRRRTRRRRRQPPTPPHPQRRRAPRCAGCGRPAADAPAEKPPDGEAARQRSRRSERPGRRSTRRDGGGRRLARRRPDRSAPASGVDRPRASRSWCASGPTPALRAGARGGAGAGCLALPVPSGCVPRRGAAPADGGPGTAHRDTE